MQNLHIDADRLWASLHEMAQIGRTPAGGVCRLALTDLDKAARDLFCAWCVAEGCSMTIDRMGNIFARREGRDPTQAPVMTGSHLDTQPTGGRFDGVYGVLAGLEAIRTLNDAGYVTQAPLEVAVWTNEEGCRFPPAMVASGVFAGVFDLEYGLTRRSPEGDTLGEELARIGYDGSASVGGRPLTAFLEAHIEQGPVLEDSGRAIGVVTGAQGQRWYEATFLGQEAHAGTTPMDRRRDALVAASRVVAGVNRLGRAHPPRACATVGALTAWPNARNTIPGKASMTIDLRHPDDDVLAEMDRSLRAMVADAADEAGVQVELEEIWRTPAVRFDAGCVAAVRAAAESLEEEWLEIVSGAGHDACHISRVAPTGMIFIPCERGLSHNEAESASPEDAAKGAQVLLQAMVALADG